MGIPKIILQTYKDYGSIPDHWKLSQQAIKDILIPLGWTYVFTDDVDNRRFIEYHFPDLLHIYDSWPHNIQRVDMFRIAWLLIYGGVYIDMDLIIQRDITPLFNSKSDLYLVNSGNIGSVITNSFLAAKPGNVILRQYLYHMQDPLPWYAYGKHLTVMCSTGPLKFTSIVKSSKQVYSVLPSKLFMPCSACDVNCIVPSDAYLKPVEGKSWCEIDTHVYNYFFCHWRMIVIVIVVIILVLILLLWYYFSRPRCVLRPLRQRRMQITPSYYRCNLYNIE